jgi:hypothetical protein
MLFSEINNAPRVPSGELYSTYVQVYCYFKNTSGLLYDIWVDTNKEGTIVCKVPNSDQYIKPSDELLKKLTSQ